MATRVSHAFSFVQEVTLNPSAINANSISKETFTVNGLLPEMVVCVNAPNLEAGVFCISAFASAANELTLVLWNSTAASVNPASQAFKVIAL